MWNVCQILTLSQCGIQVVLHTGVVGEHRCCGTNLSTHITNCGHSYKKLPRFFKRYFCNLSMSTYLDIFSMLSFDTIVLALKVLVTTIDALEHF